jgi:hypothetical protein
MHQEIFLKLIFEFFKRLLDLREHSRRMEDSHCYTNTHKKGNRNNPDNYRGISLLNT